MIIQSENSSKRQAIEMVTTIFGWLFLILFLFVLGTNIKWKLSDKFYSLEMVNVNAILLFTLVISVSSFLGMYFWVIYNKRRFGNLKRRTFPSPTKTEDISNFYLLPDSEVLQYQHEKYVER